MRIANDTYHARTYERTYASSTASRHSGAETKNVNLVTRCRDSRVGKHGWDDSIKQFSITPPYISFHIICVERKKIIGVSVSKPLSSDLNVNFVCLSYGPSAYRKSLPALILCILCHAQIQKPLESLGHEPWTV